VTILIEPLLIRIYNYKGGEQVKAECAMLHCPEKDYKKNIQKMFHQITRENPLNYVEISRMGDIPKTSNNEPLRQHLYEYLCSYLKRHEIDDVFTPEDSNCDKVQIDVVV